MKKFVFIVVALIAGMIIPQVACTGVQNKPESVVKKFIEINLKEESIVDAMELITSDEEYWEEVFETTLWFRELCSMIDGKNIDYENIEVDGDEDTARVKVDFYTYTHRSKDRQVNLEHWNATFALGKGGNDKWYIYRFRYEKVYD